MEKGYYWIRIPQNPEFFIAYFDGDYWWAQGCTVERDNMVVYGPKITIEQCSKAHSVEDYMDVVYSQLAMDAYNNVPFGSGTLVEAAREIPEVGDRWKAMDTIKKYYLK